LAAACETAPDPPLRAPTACRSTAKPFPCCCAPHSAGTASWCAGFGDRLGWRRILQLPKRPLISARAAALSLPLSCTRPAPSACYAGQLVHLALPAALPRVCGLLDVSLLQGHEALPGFDHHAHHPGKRTQRKQARVCLPGCRAAARAVRAACAQGWPAHGVHPPWSASVKSPLADALASFPFITILQIVWILFSMISGSIYFQVRTTRSHSFSHCCSLHAGTAAPVALLRACMHCHLPPPPAAWAA